jgi:beta-glucuronidase
VARKNKFPLLISTLFLISFLSELKALPSPTFPIKDVGEKFPINFEKYGSWTGKGSNDYNFKITNKSGLAAAMGAGLYPNESSIGKDPGFQKFRKKFKGQINPWDFTQSGNPQNDFYAWTTSKGDIGPGTKLLFTANALAEAGHIEQALKAYYGVLVFFPREACPSSDYQYVWYVANEAISRMEGLLERYPEIGYKLEGVKFKVINGEDNNTKNDRFVIDTGRWVKTPPRKNVDLSKLKIIQQRGYGRVHLVQYENKHWQMIVDKKPFVVKGVTYNGVPIGRHIADYGNAWMFDDVDENGRVDYPFDSWVDKNKNNSQDSDEPAVGDFQLLKDMGANAIRLYRTGYSNQARTIDGEKAAGGDTVEYDGTEFNKEVLRDLYNKYGIRVIMGEFLGAYTIGSGASWELGTDYTDPLQLENMRMVLTNFVKDHRSEPYMLMWVLGNENLMPSDYTGVNATRTQASKQVEAYLKFINEMAELIHRLDPDHPVAVGNLLLLNVEDYGKYAPAVDIFGANLYPGSTGFGNAWKKVKREFDRPVLITEYGCDAWNSKTHKEDEVAQARYHQGNWADIQLNLGGGAGEGNSIGGIIFEYLDEWWKSSSGAWDIHDDSDDSPMAFPDGWSSEEYLGIVSQGNGGRSPFLRKPRKAYTLYRDELWK